MSPDNLKSLRIDIDKQRSTGFAGQDRFEMEEQYNGKSSAGRDPQRDFDTKMTEFINHRGRSNFGSKSNKITNFKKIDVSDLK